MTATTTEPAPRARLRRGPTARARIVGWMLLLVALALGAAVFLTWSVQSARLDDRINAELGHEAAKLREFARAGVDPATGRPVSGVRALLTAYLGHNLPDDHESFFSVVDGRADRRSPYPPPARLDHDAAFVARATRIAASGRPASGWADGPAGRVRYAVLPVRMAGDRARAALVVAEFRDLQRDEAEETTRVLGFTAFGALAVAGLAGWLVAGRVLAPIRLVRQTAERIGASDLTRRLEVRGNDDVAALAGTFNTMLDRLEAAFATQRRFVDDAGHELRTPLTVIRGHLELMGDDPAERAETRELLIDELDRMNRIVDDLLVLAKAERPDFLALGEVDLADLTVETVAKARGMASRRWRVGEVAEVRVTADRQRLTQALMQLAANAVRHTGDGDTVEVGSAVRGAGVELWVRDTGPGVADEDTARIFDRFVRAGPGPRRTDGAGLGLAIVGSIARAHGGRARVERPPDGGARFVLELPLRPSSAEPSPVPVMDDGPATDGPRA
ncbi:sensor histidine kinase [Actinomadura darangshiensis]|nr:HAMP domain-containing sensor histidine kinase [Actinomadura darangshiensis]